MSDRNDEDPIGLDSVKEPVEETRNKNASKPPGDRPTAVREFNEPSRGTLNDGDEVATETLGFALEKLRGSDELGLSVRVKLNPSHRSADSALLNTRSAGIPFVFPLRSSSRRRSASSSQRRS